MINVSALTKSEYKDNSTHKELRIEFPALEIELDNSLIEYETMELTEMLCDSDSIEFVGCISSKFIIQLRSLVEDVKGQYMEVYVKIGVTDEIPLFKGYVDSIELTGTKRQKKITAYDILHTWQQTDIADWYKELDYPIVLGDFRDSLFEELGVEQVETTLPLDDFSIGRMYDPTKLCALDIIKSLCQVNGVFGRINRDGKFEYVVPAGGGSESVGVKYKEAKYQEFTVKPVNKLTVKYRDVEGVYGSGVNNYIIQNNIFLKGFDEATLQSVAVAVYPNVAGFVYRPFSADINGLPYLECIDSVTMEVEDIETYDKHELTFRVLSRTIKGVQSLRDTIEAEGDEKQKEFVSDINVQMEELNSIVDEIIDDIDSLTIRFYLITNTEDIDISDNQTKEIIDIDFQAKKDTTVVFQLEALVEVETTHVNNTIDYYDEELEVIYELNEQEIVDYHPVDNWQDGKHIFHLMRYFSVRESDTAMNLKVYFKSTGGSIHIELNTLKAMLYGQNLVASEDWDGWIKVKETASAFELPLMVFGTYADSVETELTV